jgi:hypothetical protein
MPAIADAITAQASSTVSTSSLVMCGSAMRSAGNARDGHVAPAWRPSRAVRHLDKIIAT